MKSIDEMISSATYKNHQDQSIQTFASMIPLLAMGAIFVFGTMDMVNWLTGKKKSNPKVFHDPYKIR